MNTHRRSQIQSDWFHTPSSHRGLIVLYLIQCSNVNSNSVQGKSKRSYDKYNPLKQVPCTVDNVFLASTWTALALAHIILLHHWSPSSHCKGITLLVAKANKVCCVLAKKQGYQYNMNDFPLKYLSPILHLIYYSISEWFILIFLFFFFVLFIFFRMFQRCVLFLTSSGNTTTHNIHPHCNGNGWWRWDEHIYLETLEHQPVRTNTDKGLHLYTTCFPALDQFEAESFLRTICAVTSREPWFTCSDAIIDVT